jgi:hypothetical protein
MSYGIEKPFEVRIEYSVHFLSLPIATANASKAS